MMAKVACRVQRHRAASETPLSFIAYKLVDILARADRLQCKALELLVNGVVANRGRRFARCADVDEHVGDRMPGARRTVFVNLKTGVVKCLQTSRVETTCPRTSSSAC